MEALYVLPATWWQ